MGLGSFLKKIVKTAAPIVSTVAPFFGPAGMVAGAVAGALAPRNGNGGALPGGAPISGLPAALPTVFGGGPTAAVAGMLPSATGILRGAAGMVGGLLPSVGRIAGAAAGVLRTAAGRIRGVVLASGRFVSSKKAAALARRVGIEAASVALGVSAVELAEMVLADEEARGRRRARGITGREMRTTRRTIGKVMRLHSQIVSACRAAGVPRRRAAPRAFVPAHKHRLVSVK